MRAITTTVASIVLIATTVAAGAEWDEVQEAANGGYYTAIDSSNVGANELAVYFRAENECSPHMIMFDYYNLETGDIAEWDQLGTERFDSVVDLNVLFASAAPNHERSKAFIAFDHYQLDNGAYFGVAKIEFTPEEGIIDSLKNGDEVAVRFQAPGGEWSQMHEYGLAGASGPLIQAEQSCRKKMVALRLPSPTPKMITRGSATLVYL